MLVLKSWRHGVAQETTMTVSGYGFSPLFTTSESEKEELRKRNRQIDLENRKAPRNERGEIPD
jgi:predicted ABC-type exoprotein transport system permease subunit